MEWRAAPRPMMKGSQTTRPKENLSGYPPWTHSPPAWCPIRWSTGTTRGPARTGCAAPKAPSRRARFGTWNVLRALVSYKKHSCCLKSSWDMSTILAFIPRNWVPMVGISAIFRRRLRISRLLAQQPISTVLCREQFNDFRSRNAQRGFRGTGVDYASRSFSLYRVTDASSWSMSHLPGELPRVSGTN